jgi:hypothetical protein
MQPHKIRYKSMMVLTSKPEIEIDAALPTEELVGIYFTPTPKVLARSRKEFYCLEGEFLDSKDSKGHQNYCRQWLKKHGDLERFRPSKVVIPHVLCLCVYC